jgi:hypothetical protein
VKPHKMTVEVLGSLAFFTFKTGAIPSFLVIGSDDVTKIEIYESVINLDSVERCWSVGHAVPQLIKDIANLIAPWPNPAVGYVRFQGARFDDYWIELGGDLSEQFGKFIHLPDGTYIAMWFHDGAEPGAEPVVEIGSEGELNILAPNIQTFMLKWANGNVHRELDPDPDDSTPEYLAQRKIYATQMIDIIAASPDGPVGTTLGNLPKFMDDWQTAAFARVAADPVMIDILKLMEPHVPMLAEGSDPATTYVAPASYMIRIAGGRVEIQTPAVPPDYTSFQALPEREALIPLLLKARENRTKLYPGRGLWHDAMLEIYVEKYVLLKASWEFEPSFREGGRMTKAELEADLARFPRDPRWRQPWMDELV